MRTMKPVVFVVITLLLVACSTAQSAMGQSAQTINTNGENWQLQHDTLYAGNGSVFFEGQELVIGDPAGDDGYYRSIIYKSAIVPSIWGQDNRYDHAIENHVNRKKGREQVKRLLTPGKSVRIKSISLWKGGKPNFYLVTLSSDGKVFMCDLQFALSLKEISIP